jgi:hypothetical protein
MWWRKRVLLEMRKEFVLLEKDVVLPFRKKQEGRNITDSLRTEDQFATPVTR